MIKTTPQSVALFIIHRISHPPLLTQAVHKLHHVEGLVERHLLWLQESINKCLATGDELVFVARYLLRHMDILHELTVVGIHCNLLRIVDIVNDQVSVSASNHANIIAYTGGTRLQTEPGMIRSYRAQYRTERSGYPEIRW